MAREEWKAFGRGLRFFKFDSENFIDPSAKRNYGNELGSFEEKFHCRYRKPL